MKLTTDMIIDDEYIMFGDKVTRFEVIDNKGRSYVKHGVKDLSFQIQDDGTTIKVFLQYEDEEEICID
jgi:hypothetical protein